MPSDARTNVSSPACKRTRVRGYAPWRPRADAQRIVAAIDAVLVEYVDYLPMTLRQVFYRLVGTEVIDKTQDAYERLGEIVNRGRRAGVISWDAIRDDGVTREEAWGYGNVEHYLRISLSASGYKRHPRDGQRNRLFVLTEAAGMLPMLAPTVHEYGGTIASSGGFDSTTWKRDLARHAESEDVVVLHVGDHDPSGVHVYQSLVEDVTAFAANSAGRVNFERVAVLPAHIDTYALPTAPAKSTDRRAFSGETVQAEALPPDVLVDLVRQAVTRHTDLDVWQANLDQSDAERDYLRDVLARVADEIGGAR